MSAIFGLINRDGRPAPRSDLDLMSAALAGHGPDGQGAWTENHIGLGHRLMCFTPEDRLERQPLTGVHGNCTLIAAGRVDNRPELTNDIGITRAESREMPDSTLILRAYEKWGPDCCSRLVGSFVFAVYDRREDRLVLARSAMSRHPLYYHAAAGRFAFASAPKGLFALPWIPREIDGESLADYLVYAPCNSGKSLFAGVNELEEGHLLIVRRDHLSVQKYWRPELCGEIRFTRDSDYIEAFNALFERVVADHLRSLTPVGIMMSGGLDSSSIAVTAARLLSLQGKRLNAFTEVPRAGFDFADSNKYADETPLVRAIGSRCNNLDLNFVHTSGLFLDDIQPYFDAAEAPFRGAWNRKWFEAILREAGTRNVHVLMTGGWGNLTISRSGEGLLPELIRRGRWLTAIGEARAYARQGGGTSVSGVLSRDVAHLLPTPLWLLAKRMLRPGDLRAADSPWQMHSPIHPDFARHHRVLERARQKGHNFYPRPGLVNRAQRYAEARRWGNVHPITLGYEALFGIQYRHPAGDRRIVEFCISLPEEQHRHNGIPRSLIRRAMADRLPEGVLANRKSGLQTSDWLERAKAGRSQMLEELDRLDQSEWARTALDLPRVRTLVENMPEGTSAARPPSLKYRSLLGSAFMTGGFLRWFEASGRGGPSRMAHRL